MSGEQDEGTRPVTPIEVTEETPAFVESGGIDQWAEVTPPEEDEDEDVVDATDAWVEIEQSPVPDFGVRVASEPRSSSFETPPSFIPTTAFEDAPSIQPHPAAEKSQMPPPIVRPAPFEANVGSVVIDDLVPSRAAEALLPPERPLVPIPELEAPRFDPTLPPRASHDIWGFSSEIDVPPPQPRHGAVVIDDVPIDDADSPRRGPSREDATAMFAAELSPTMRPQVDDLLEVEAPTTTVASFTKQMQRSPKKRPVTLDQSIRMERKPPKTKTVSTPSTPARLGRARCDRHYPMMRALLKDPDAVPFGNDPPHVPAAPPVPGTFFPAAREPRVQPAPADLDGLLAAMADGLLIGETADGYTEIRVTLKDEFFAGTELRIVLGEKGLVAELVPPDREIYWQLSGNVDELRERLTGRGLSVTEVKVSYP